MVLKPHVINIYNISNIYNDFYIKSFVINQYKNEVGI